MQKTTLSASKSPVFPKVLMLLWTFLVLTAASVCLGIMGLYFSTGSYKVPMLLYYLRQPRLVLLNVLPFTALCLLVWAISNRAWVGFLTGGALCLAYSWVEYWKLMSRSEPLYAEELVLVREAMQISGQYISVTWQIGLSLILVILGTLFIAFLCRAKMPHWTCRLILPLLLVLGCWQLYTNVYTSSKVYQSFAVYPGLNIWTDNNRYVSRGGMYPFLYSVQSAFHKAPEGYRTADAKELLQSYETDPIPEDRKVSVIMVMYEAFSDLTDYTDAITQRNPYGPFHALQEESISGKLVTNIFAGGTVDTERCVLTGYASLSSFRRPAWSYARYFAENGYALNGSHPSLASFYSRSSVNRNLGFSDYLFLENHYEALSGRISPDKELLPEITRLCMEDLEQGKPVFSFNVTYQNHGPYNAAELNRFDGQEFMPQGDLGEEAYYIVNNYLNGIADTSEAMWDMAETFRHSEEPVILVFFGDHKPWLGDQGSVYPLLGIDFEGAGDESFYNYYDTEYLIWANDAAKETLGNSFVGTGPEISPCYLMNVLFEQCGWEGPSYQKLTDTVMEVLPVVSTRDRYRENGSLVSRSELTPAAEALLEKLEYAQYYLSVQSGGSLPE